MQTAAISSPRGAVEWPWSRRLLWMALLAVACFLHGAFYVRTLTAPGGNIADFFQEWASAKNLSAGLPIYTPLRETVPLYLVNTSTSEYFTEINAHPPTAVLLALPLARLNYETAFLVWNWLSLAAVVASGRLIVRELRLQWTPWSWLPAITVLLGSPFLEHLALGQLGAFLLLLITAAWLADRRGHDVTAGALLATATAIKLFPGFLLLYFVFKGKWRTVAACAAAFVAITVLTAVVVGPEAYVDYVNGALPEVAKFRPSWSNRSLQGFWLRLFDPATGTVTPLLHSPWLARVAFIASAVGLLIVLGVLTRRSRSRETDDLVFGLYLPAMLLVSPITWDHYFILLVPTAILVGRRLTRPDALRGVFRLSLLAMWINPFFFFKLLLGTTWEPRAISLSQNLLVVSISVYALLAVFVVTAAVARRALAETVRDAARPECRELSALCLR